MQVLLLCCSCLFIDSLKLRHEMRYSDCYCLAVLECASAALQSSALHPRTACLSNCVSFSPQWCCLLTPYAAVLVLEYNVWGESCLVIDENMGLAAAMPQDQDVQCHSDGKPQYGNLLQGLY